MTDIAGKYRRAMSWLGEDRSVRISTGVFAVLSVITVTVCSLAYLGNPPVSFVAPWLILAGTLAALLALIALVRDRNRHLLQARESAALANIGRVISLSPDLGDVYDRFAAEVKKLVSFDRIVIVLVDTESGTATFRYQHGQAVAGREGDYAYPLEGQEIQRIVAEGNSSIRTDIAENPEFRADQVLLEAGLRSSARLPLIAKGRVIGTLNLHSFQVGTYGVRERIILEHLANQIAPTIENTHLYEQTRTAEKQAQERSEELSVLVDVASILTEPGDFLDRATRVMEQLAKVSTTLTVTRSNSITYSSPPIHQTRSRRHRWHGSQGWVLRA